MCFPQCTVRWSERAVFGLYQSYRKWVNKQIPVLGLKCGNMKADTGAGRLIILKRILHVEDVTAWSVLNSVSTDYRNEVFVNTVNMSLTEENFLVIWGNVTCKNTQHNGVDSCIKYQVIPYCMGVNICLDKIIDYFSSQLDFSTLMHWPVCDHTSHTKYINNCQSLQNNLRLFPLITTHRAWRSCVLTSRVRPPTRLAPSVWTAPWPQAQAMRSNGEVGWEAQQRGCTSKGGPSRRIAAWLFEVTQRALRT